MDKKQQYMELISGDTLIIATSLPIIPLKGIASVVDWRLNSLISTLILEKRFVSEIAPTLMLYSKDKLPVDRTILFAKIDNFPKELASVLQGIKSQDFSLVIPDDWNIDLKLFFDNIKKTGIKWTELKTHTMAGERLITFTGVNYE